MLRVLVLACVGVMVILAFVVAVGIAPIDRTPDRAQLYDAMIRNIDSLTTPSGPHHGFLVGYNKTNLTPSYRTATAGYGKRMGKLFTEVRDSLYVRTLVVDNGQQRVAIVSADLLIIPPTVTALLERELPDIGFSLDNTFLGAVHTHNGIGNWGTGVMGFLYGSYDEALVQFIADQIKHSIERAALNVVPSSLKSGALSLRGIVHNRLTDAGRVDSMLRVLEIDRSDGTRLLLMSATAHATCLSSKDLRLSRDYPGKLVDRMEAAGYSFSMFLAGAVGSHTGSAPEQGESCVEWMAQEISDQFLANANQLVPLQDSVLVMYRVPLLLSDPQAKIFGSWRIRPWLFTMAFGDYPEYLTALRLGNLVLLGTPCDFSGEFSHTFDSLAVQQGLQTMVTSFNGGYIGYVTPDKYYDYDHYETQLMSWYGPGNGEYLRRCLEQLLHKVEQVQ